MTTDTTQTSPPQAAEEMTQDEKTIATFGAYEYGWRDSDEAGQGAERGLSAEVVANISDMKDESEWMRKRRQKALRLYDKKPMPHWGADISDLDFDSIKYFVRSTDGQATSWDDLPEDIKNTYDRLGIPEAEQQQMIAGVAAQYESEVVYHQINEELEGQGVRFLETDTALREDPENVHKYFGTVSRAGENESAALNTAVWSGGRIGYVPAGVHGDIPLQAYYRLNAENMGQF